MKFCNIIFLLFLTSHILVAQQIKVVDKLTKNPIPGVALYNKDKTKSAITNLDGEARLDVFLSAEMIYFQHLSYLLEKLEKSQIDLNSPIYLEASTHSLDEIIISASNFKQSERDIPQKIVSLNSEAIQFSNAQTSADLLESTGQVYIQKSQMGGGSPMIRGFSTNRLLITIDGVRMNNAIFRGGNVHNVIALDPFSLERTEVTLGAGSVIYGSDAVGGVMSFYTSKPKRSETDTLLVQTNATARYATANAEKTGHLDVNLGYKKWAFLSHFSYSDFNDLRMGSHGPLAYLRPEFVWATKDGDVVIDNKNPKTQKHSGYSQINLMQKVHFQSDDNLSFDLGLHYSTTSNIPRYDRLIRYKNEALRAAEWYYGPQRWLMSNLQITKLSSRSNLYNKIKATVAYQNFQESRTNRDFQSSIKHLREEAVDAYSFNLDFEKSLSPKSTLFYGFEYVYNKVRSYGNEENITNHMVFPSVSRYPNGASWLSAALYSSFKYKPNPKFVFQSGLRFNHVVSKANFESNNAFLNLPFKSSENKAGALTGTAGISWSPNKTLQWKLNASSAFRAPNIDDIGKVFDSEPGSVVVPNQNLRPEYAYGAEVGLRLSFGPSFKLDMSSYYTYLDNALVRRPYNLNNESKIMYDGELSEVQAIQNASKAWIYGFEVGLDMRFTKNLKLSSQYSVIGGTEEQDNIEVPIRHVAPSFGNTHLVWNYKNVKVDFFANYNAELSFYQLAPSEVEKDYLYAKDANGNPYAPAWTTLNMRTQYKINTAATLSLSLENITDKRYKTYSSGIASAGRNLILAVKYSL
ncbi:TonB-dependent receptor [Oceanihabitans sp. IOP_32]|uniref:TonB-dependent receptor n=1 Tax=Oceanihabitans sp. IOP_32 TaxID=2529032 RepID=UPI00129403A7|nr:TonB-dependent receptor [Oceanihabitans sp. IOP_32]QFZ54299.1 TonB-dependent receptor [Oceanihabitans sp. IOP_32]